jgi:hypothetical protein
MPSDQLGNTTDYVELFAESLQCSIRDTLRTAKGLPIERSYFRDRAEYMEARDWFLSSFPLLGAVASSFRIVDDRETVQRMDIPVAAISPQMSEIYINPRCRLNRDEWKFVLAHEFLHAALRHDVRCEDRNPELWNVACDYVVNGWLVEMGVGAIPEFALFDEMFRGLSVEAVYDTICEDIRRYRAESAGDILYGDESWWSSLDGSEVDALYRSALQQGLAYHQEQSRGFLPAGLVEEIYALSRPPIRWDIELAKWFDEQPLSTFLIFPMIVVGQLLGGSHPFYASPQRHPFLIWCEGPIITCILQKKRFLAQGVDWEKRNMPFRLITASILLFSAKRESMSPTK